MAMGGSQPSSSPARDGGTVSVCARSVPMAWRSAARRIVRSWRTITEVPRSRKRGSNRDRRLESEIGQPILDGVGPTLRFVGLAILAAAVVLLLAAEGGWAPSELSDQWFLPLAKIGAICFVWGLGLSLLQPVMRRVRQGHCVRCGAATERGQSYCLDHLQG